MGYQNADQSIPKAVGDVWSWMETVENVKYAILQNPFRDKIFEKEFMETFETMLNQRFRDNLKLGTMWQYDICEEYCRMETPVQWFNSIDEAAFKINGQAYQWPRVVCRGVRCWLFITPVDIHITFSYSNDLSPRKRKTIQKVAEGYVAIIKHAIEMVQSMPVAV